MLRGGPMSRSIKFNDDTYLDSKGVDYKHTNLETTLDNIIAKNNTQDTNITNVSNRVTTNTNNIATNTRNITNNADAIAAKLLRLVHKRLLHQLLLLSDLLI